MPNFTKIRKTALSLAFAFADGTALGLPTASSVQMFTNSPDLAAAAGIMTFLLIGSTNFFFQGRVIRDDHLLDNDDRPDPMYFDCPEHQPSLMRRILHSAVRTGYVISACLIDFLILYFSMAAINGWVDGFSSESNYNENKVVPLSSGNLALLVAYYSIVTGPFNFVTGIQETIDSIDSLFGCSHIPIISPNISRHLQFLYHPDFVRRVGSMSHTLEHVASITLVPPTWLKKVVENPEDNFWIIAGGSGVALLMLTTVCMQTYLFEGSAVAKNFKHLLNRTDDPEIKRLTVSKRFHDIAYYWLILGAVAHGSDALFDVTKSIEFFDLSPHAIVYGGVVALMISTGNKLTEVQAARDELDLMVEEESEEATPLLQIQSGSA